MLLSVLLVLETFILAKVGRYVGSATLSYHYDNIIVILMAISLFLLFTKLHIKSRFINWVASSSFFVYIISENNYVWNHPNGIYDLLRASTWNTMNIYPILVLAAAFFIFIFCIVIDKIRQLTFGKLESKIGDYSEKIIGKLPVSL